MYVYTINHKKRNGKMQIKCIKEYFKENYGTHQEERNIKIVLRKWLLFITGVLFFTVMIGSVNYISCYARLASVYTKDHRCWIVCGMILLVICISAFSDFISKMKQHIKIVRGGVSFFLIFRELFFMYSFYCYPSSDSAEIVNAAIHIANGNRNYMANADYFERYRNNNFLTIVTAEIYKVCQFITHGNIDYVILNNVINIILLNISLYLAYCMIKKHKGEESACKMLFLAALDPVMYMSVAWYYSATISVFFSTCILYLAIGSWNTRQEKIIKSAGIGICTAIGYYLRPTVVITFIAVIIVLFLKNIKSRKSFISYMKKLSVCILSIVISVAGIKALCNMYTSGRDRSYPITRWISIGLEEDGTISSYGKSYPKNIKNKKERIEYDMNRMKKNISGYNFFTFGKHLVKKIYVNWCDGSSSMPVKLKSDIKHSKWYYRMVSQKADGWLIYCQVFRGTICLLILFSVLKNFRKTNCIDDIFYLNAFGAFLFYMIWEAKSDYNIPFLLLFLCMAYNGMDWHRELVSYKVQMHMKKIAISGIIFSIMAGILLFWNKKNIYTDRRFDFADEIISVNRKPLKSLKKIGRKNITILQNIKIDRQFNTIKLYCKKLNGKGTYTIGLYNVTYKELKCIREWKGISGIQVQNGQEKQCLLNDEDNEKGFFILNLNMLLGKGDYILKISPESGNDSIGWFYNPFGYFDCYEGTTLLNGIEKQGELAICISRRTKRNYY